MGRKVGGFILLERIGEGGFGRVYRGEQPTLGRKVVVKVLHERLRGRDVLLQRFLREAQLAARLAHPYVAHIYGFDGEDDGLVWIAMEYVHGTTLKQWLRDHGPMSLEQLVPLFEGIAEVVQSAHDHEIVHRDLTPANVMVIERGDRLIPKLLDFGVAKLLGGEKLPESTPETIQRLRKLMGEKVPEQVLKQFREGRPSTVTGNSPPPGGSQLTPDDATIGTPGYMAPEQWSREFLVGPAADLYALGVIAYEALTGHRPFKGDAPLNRDLVPALGGSFPPSLDQVFQRALARRPKDRFGTALELAGALRGASGLGASSADPPKLDAEVRDAWLADAPQPLAEAVAALDDARNAHQARSAAQELVRGLLRYLLVVALATHVQASEGQDDPALLELVRALDRRELLTEERLRLVRLLVRPQTGRRSAHPIPALVDLVLPGSDGTDGLAPILALHGALDHAGAEDMVRSRLSWLVPELTQLLGTAAFVLEYVLVVPRNRAAERWTGRRRRPRALATVSGGELVDEHPMLLDPNGRVCVDLWPLAQAAPPTEGAQPELFQFDAHGPHGARMIAAPSGLEYHGSIARMASDWVTTHVVSAIEAQARMRERIRVAAHQWQDRDRPNALLWRGEVLADLERWMRQAGGTAPLGEPEALFVAASRRSGRRARWLRRLLVAAPVAIVLAAVAGYSALQTRMARQATETSFIQGEVEQGRQALLHDDTAEAQLHLSEAFQRGERSKSVAFMLARALQPRMAEQARFTAAAGHMWSAAFSPDGRQIVTTDDACARIWDARTNGLLFMLPHGDTVYHAVYSVDGAWLATAGGDGAVKTWSAASGALLRELRHDGKPLRYYTVAISPDGKLIAAIDMAGAVVDVWDAASGALLAELRNKAWGMPSIAFSSTGSWLATSGGSDARVFDTGTWSQALAIVGPHIRALSFDPTGPRLATGTGDGDASIWEIPSGARARHLREIGDPVNVIAFSPDGQLVIAGTGRGAVQVWRATTGTFQSQFNAMRGKVLTVDFDPTSKLVVAAGDRGEVIVADALRGMPETSLAGTRGAVMTVHFDPTSRRIVGASGDGTARVWDVTSPYRRWTSPPVTDDCGLVTSLEPDGRFLAIGCGDHVTRVWDTAHDSLLAELPGVTPVAGDFTSAFPAVDAGGDRAAIARGNTVEIYELSGGRLLRTIRHDAPVNAVAFGPAGHDLVSGATDGSLLVTRDDREPIVLPASSGGIDAAAILPDGLVAAVNVGRRLRLYDPDRHTLLADFETPTRVQLLRLSPDGTRLITIPSHTGNAAPPILWDLEHHRSVVQLEAHNGYVFSARFTASGIVTVGGDGTARLWEPDTGRLLQTYRSTASFLADAVIDPEGAMIIAGDNDGVLWFWDLSTGRPLWKLQAHRSRALGIHFEGNALVSRGSLGEVSRWMLPTPERVIEAPQTK
ncbi:MAG TPA: protein kinase [Kofleriaceae bacterium]|nr:protein kinase [Kofleriaceae bacterium]